MSEESWLVIIVTLVASVPVTYVIAILATMHAPRLVHFLESRKLLKKEKTRKQALDFFFRVKAFRDGTKDKYAYYILLASGAVVSSIIGSMLVLITVFQNEFPVAIPFAVIILLAVLAALMTLILLTSIYETARRIERFDDYKAEVEKAWGSIDKES
ncbi:MAG TPA: hypothetical protein VFC54_00350 [Pseudolabrys sp.]|nr:hypothetical protein [Pseudolabrys sp.]